MQVSPSHSLADRSRPSTHLSSPLQPIRDRWHRHQRLLEGRRLLGLVLVTATALLLYNASAVAQRQNAQYQDQRWVYVAAQDLAAGSVITSDGVLYQPWPAHLVPPAAVTADPTGDGLVQRIGQGEPITSSRVGHGAFGLALDELALAIPIPLAPPPVEEGQRVLLIAVQPPDGPFQPTSSILTNARVLLVTELAITVAIPEREARPLVEALATGSVEVIITPG